MIVASAAVRIKSTFRGYPFLHSYSGANEVRFDEKHDFFNDLAMCYGRCR